MGIKHTQDNNKCNKCEITLIKSIKIQIVITG